MKRGARTNILDRLHRGVVYTCIGLTVYGGYLLSLRVHRYITVTRPNRQAAELQMIQEGSPVRPAPSPDSLIDHAPKLRG